MDAFELLKRDHEKVSELFKEIESASGNVKLQVFSRLKGELDIHAHIEETILYPALEKTEEAREITLEAYEEHKVVKDLLAELASAGAPDDQWDAKLTVLKENVEHHVEEEEGEMFAKARKALSSDELERIGMDLEAEKAAQQGTPAKPQSPRKQSANAAKSQKATATRGDSGAGKKAEAPGVLARLANFIGLGESPTPERKGSRKAGKSAGSTKASKARKSPASSSSKTAKARVGATKSKSASKKSNAGGSKGVTRSGSTSKKTAAGKSKAASKTNASRANKRTAPKVAGKKAAKAKPRAAAKKGNASKSTKRSRTR
jgi:hypothetical protein